MTNLTTLPAQLTDETLLTTQQLVTLTNISRQTYEGWRCRKDGGPEFKRLGPTLVRYRWADFKAWRDRQTDTCSATSHA
jgi:predicted DNA-binding transcriptional regulator AlpA